MSTDPTALERDIDAAEARYQQALAALNRPDGSPMYAPDEQREREQAARAAFSKDLAAISERLDAIVAVEAVDPTKTMTTVELERIGLRTPIVTEDLRNLPEAVQVARLRAALTSGERAERYVALRAGRALLAERNARRGQEPTTLRNGRPVVTPPDYSELAAVVRELEAGFIDSARRQRAEERIAAAQRVSGALGARRYMAAQYGPDRRRATVGTR